MTNPSPTPQLSHASFDINTAHRSPTGATMAVLTAGVSLAACGGADRDDLTTDGLNVPQPSGRKQLMSKPQPATGITEPEAARFLVQAAMGAQMNDIQNVCSLGYAGWITSQMVMPIGQSCVDWLYSINSHIHAPSARFDFDKIIWKRYLSNTDQLRQRMAFALSQIFAIDVQGLPGGWWPSFLAGNFMDLLEKNAFGNFRTLLEDVSLSTAMGLYLTHKGNARADGNGRTPDENYAREIMQLFTIGLVELNDDGTLKLGLNGLPVDTYNNTDIEGLARVFTGWDHHNRVDRKISTTTPMTLTANRHEPGTKIFLGLTIPAGTSGSDSLKRALDHLFNHANVPPFIARQLIQRFVSSNPSPAYTARVAAAFRNNGAGVRGDLGATLSAVLLDTEARAAPGDVGSESRGKLREPILRFTAWARASKVTSPSGKWEVRSTEDPATELGQSPGRAPSVFNFYRPGYVPPGTDIARRGLVAPELQITTESSVAGYLNFMQRAITDDKDTFLNTLKADYSDWEALANEPAALVQRANLLLSGGGLSAKAMATIEGAIATMPLKSAAHARDRVQATMLLAMAAPDTLVSR